MPKRLIPPPPMPGPAATLPEILAARDLAHAVAVLTDGRPRLHAAAALRLAELDARADAARAAWLQLERAKGGPGQLEPPPMDRLPHYLKAWPAPPAVACPVCDAAPLRYCPGGLPHGARLILEAGGTPAPRAPRRPTGQALMAAQGVRGTYLDQWPALFPAQEA